jgi:hypothetical protein
MNRLVTELNADGRQLLKEEMRLLLRDIIRFTPPRSQSQGRNAIKGDLFGGKRKSGARYSSIGLFQRIGSSTLVPPRKATGETVGVNLGWEQSKSIRIYKKFWRPNASVQEMESFYKRFQNPRTGRPGFVSRSVIGRWKVQDQMWVSDAAANKFFRHLAQRVGYAKAGWIRAARSVGLNLPGWVMRHEAYSKGGYKPPRPSDMSIEAICRTAKIPNYFERHVRPAMISRVISFTREVERLLKGGKSRRASFAGTATGAAD